MDQHDFSTALSIIANLVSVGAVLIALYVKNHAAIEAAAKEQRFQRSAILTWVGAVNVLVIILGIASHEADARQQAQTRLLCAAEESRTEALVSWVQRLQAIEVSVRNYGAAPLPYHTERLKAFIAFDRQLSAIRPVACQ